MAKIPLLSFCFPYDPFTAGVSKVIGWGESPIAPARYPGDALKLKNNGIPKLERLVGARLLGGFQKFARTVVRTSGHPMAFVIAIGTIVIWALTGPWFRFGNTWLLVINTVANIITFLMIFLIRNAQNRESEAVQLKLDELIRATKAAQNSLLDIEELSEEELDRIKARFERLARMARAESSAGETEFTRREVRQDAAVIAQSNPGGPPGERVRQSNEFDSDNYCSSSPQPARPAGQ